nr:hypothetical protein [Tanacetum cinerariifolium]
MEGSTVEKAIVCECEGAQGCWVLLGRMMEGSGESWVRWRRSRNVGNGVLQVGGNLGRTHQGDTLTIRTSLFFLPLLE